MTTRHTSMSLPRDADDMLSIWHNFLELLTVIIMIHYTTIIIWAVIKN